MPRVIIHKFRKQYKDSIGAKTGMPNHGVTRSLARRALEREPHGVRPLGRELLKANGSERLGPVMGVSVFALLLLALLTLPSFAYADNENVDFNVTVGEPANITVDVSSSLVALSLSAPFNGSSFGTDSVSVTVNGGSSKGYTLTMYSNSVLTMLLLTIRL